MKRPIEFRTSAIRKFIGGIDKDAREQLELAFDEIDADQLTKKIIDGSADSSIIAWDIYLLGLIDTSIGYYDLFKDNCIEGDVDRIEPQVAMNRLKWKLPSTVQGIRNLTSHVGELKDSPVGTIAIFVIGRTSNSNKSLSIFWHHPQLWESDSVKLLKTFAGYSQHGQGGE